MSTDADASTSAQQFIDKAATTARSEFIGVNEYAQSSWEQGTDRLVVVLFGVWVLGFAVLSLIIGIPLALIGLLLDGTASSGAVPLLIGFLGATGLTASVAQRARQGSPVSDTEDERNVTVRILDAGAGTVLSLSDRLVGYVSRVYLTRSRRDYGLVMLAIWVVSVIAFTFISALLFFPVGFIATVGSLPSIVGFVGGTALFAWIGWRARGEAYQRSHGHSQSKPTGQHQENHDQQRSNSQPQKQQTQNRYVARPPDLDFSDVMGMEQLKIDLNDKIVEPFRGSETYAKYGVSSDKGVLFHGPPGTGKTYLARAIAGELGVNFLSVDVGDIESKWIGEGTENIKRLFAEARASQPCVVFIDEIDALAADRNSDQHGDKKKMVNQLLQELSNIDVDDKILVIGATNNPEQVDDAMMRTGRFDSTIEIPPPDDDARIEIFQHHLQAPAESIDRSKFVRATQGMVASDMEVLARRSALAAARREQQTGREGVVRQEDILAAAEELSDRQGSVGEFVQRPPDMNFSDVAGMEELKNTLRGKIIDPLNDPEFHEQFGLGIENGILFYGPPGTGKTYTARALAGELDISFINAKAGDLVSKWIGEGAQNVQKMFEEARSNQPCLIFIDEIDALATDRNAGHQQKSERQMVNQFLEELSQLSDEGEDVIVIGATNRIDDIDSAMLRTGRFTEKIEVPPPDAEARVAIFRMHLSAPADELAWHEIAEQTEGMVASDMESIAQQAARGAMQRARKSGGAAKNNTKVTQQDVTEAIREVRQGRATAD